MLALTPAARRPRDRARCSTSERAASTSRSSRSPPCPFVEPGETESRAARVPGLAVAARGDPLPLRAALGVPVVEWRDERAARSCDRGGEEDSGATPEPCARSHRSCGAGRPRAAPRRLPAAGGNAPASLARSRRDSRSHSWRRAGRSLDGAGCHGAHAPRRAVRRPVLGGTGGRGRVDAVLRGRLPVQRRAVVLVDRSRGCRPGASLDGSAPATRNGAGCLSRLRPGSRRSSSSRPALLSATASSPRPPGSQPRWSRSLARRPRPTLALTAFLDRFAP